MTPARLAAVRALVAIGRGATTMAAEMERARRGVDEPRDRALLLETVAGALRWQNRLDYLLERASRRPAADLDAQVRAVLRAGAYQLLHLERVPAHAVVHDSVEIVRTLGHQRAAGFVNAVLRAIARLPRPPSLPEPPRNERDRDAALRYLTITLSHPEWLAARWIDRHGFAAARTWCEFDNQPPELTVRSIEGLGGDVLIERLRAAGVEAAPAVYLADAVRLPAGALGRLPPALRAGVMVQEEASQIVAHAVGARPGERVLDACAAPGGKTIVIASDLAGSGLLVASDRRPGRVALLRATLEQTRTRAEVVALDATRPLPFGAVFDRVLIDVPCSGLGTLRRDPDVKWTRAPDDLARFADAQLAIARQAADAVAPGGALVYATCSSEPEENERVIERLLAERADFAREPARPDAHVRRADELVDADGYLRTLPFEHGLDAFFAATLVRRRDGGRPGPARP
jgi:16S rRNA (cytosine967-C5)-methyltransferase